MKIVAAIKVVPDDESIFVAGDRSLDYSKAQQTISTYDLNAIEAGAQLAAATGGNLVAISASGAKANDSKVKKSILSRGPEELFMVADDSLATVDSNATAQALKTLLDKVGDYDLVICGDGSADMYAGQVDVQLAAALGVPVVNAVTKLTMEGDTLVVERTLDTEVEEIEVPLPAVVAVSPEVAEPRIAGMKEILAAGKKPATIEDAAAAGVTVNEVVEISEIKAPEMTPRKGEIYDLATDGDLDKFCDAVAQAIR